MGNGFVEGKAFSIRKRRCNEWFQVAIFDEFFPTCGPATTPKHWHVLFFRKQGEE
jgi:hypothetical protein